MKIHWSGRQALRSSAIWLPALLLGLLAWRHRWVADDGFIDLHIVDNLLRGLGPVFNRGERVEAYTSPLWVALIALGGIVAQAFTAGDLPPLEWIAVVLGISCAVASLVFAALASTRLQRAPGESGRPTLPFGSLVILAIIPFWDYSTSGLETSLVFLWLSLAFWSCVRLRDPVAEKAQLLAGFAIGLGPLVRPDLGLFSLLFGGLAIAWTSGWRGRLQMLAAMLALPVAYQLFRMGYFACLVPNTALAKEAGLAYWSHGWIYWKEFERTYQLWIPLLVLGAAEGLLMRRFWRAGDRRGALLVGSALVGGVLYGVYITRVGGDFLHGRMLLPALFALVLPVAAVGLRDFGRFGLVLLPWAILCFWKAEVPLDDDRPGIERGRLNFILLSKNDHPVTLADYENMGWSKEVDKLFQDVEHAKEENVKLVDSAFYSQGAGKVLKSAELAPWVHADVVAYRGAVGIFAYKARQRVFICDYHGLADPVASRLELASVDKNGVWHSGRGKPGHEKRLKADWCVARTLASIEGKPRGGNERFALDALGCGDLAELQSALDYRLSWSRFWKNVWLAPRLTRLRIPQDILEARQRLCLLPAAP